MQAFLSIDRSTLPTICWFPPLQGLCTHLLTHAFAQKAKRSNVCECTVYTTWTVQNGENHKVNSLFLPPATNVSMGKEDNLLQ